MSDVDNSGRQPAGLLELERELILHCQSELLSEEGLREIIKRHGLTTNDYAGDYVFFFFACDNERVTEGVIQCLLEYFPRAMSATDDDGWSPLHWACDNPNRLGIFKLLLDASPQSVLEQFAWDKLRDALQDM